MSDGFYSVESLLHLFRKFGVGFRPATDTFFDAGNKLIKPFIRMGVVSNPPDVDAFRPVDIISCSVPHCEAQFESLENYENHYNSLHRFTCAECRKSFPSAHLLDLHVSENHDSFFLVSTKKRPMYCCYIEECGEKHWTSEERRDHCISVHKFPHNFRFGLPMKVTKEDAKMDTCQPQEGAKETKKALKSFTFGHGVTRTFEKGAAKQKTGKSRILEDDGNKDMVMDLMESLPE
ncbi:protein lethal(2)k10201 [Phlebotomus argentipes]|uniref:protein lethal(2)k10201 n=1 Tax=Phlebotomus argentipes TaxID=94469 RepID=UPI002892F534|nr:protein lethal(2)k10201 [Phlebotomus argentipes]